jgi:hypothetical protein
MQLEGAISFNEFKSKLPSLSKDQEIVFYWGWAKEASAAGQAAKYIGMGYKNAKALGGGIEAWKKSGYSVIDPKWHGVSWGVLADFLLYRFLDWWYVKNMIQKTVNRRTLHDFSSIREDLIYWLNRTPEERVATVDYLRKQYHGSTERLQRSARVIKRS